MGLNVDPAFYPRLLDWEERHGVSAEEPLRLMASESGLDSKIRNSIGCVGLNQMCKGTLEGFFRGSGTKDYGQLSKEFLALPASQQMDPIEALWDFRARQYGLQKQTARDLYWLNFLPATYETNASDATIIVPNAKLSKLGFSERDMANIIKANPSIAEKDEVNGIPVEGMKGRQVIRVAGLVRLLEKTREYGAYKKAVTLLNAAREGRADEPPPPPPTPPDRSVSDLPSAGGPVIGPPRPPSSSIVTYGAGMGIVMAVLAALWSMWKGR